MFSAHQNQKGRFCEILFICVYLNELLTYYRTYVDRHWCNPTYVVGLHQCLFETVFAGCYKQAKKRYWSPTPWISYTRGPLWTHVYETIQAGALQQVPHPASSPPPEKETSYALCPSAHHRIIPRATINFAVILLFTISHALLSIFLVHHRWHHWYYCKIYACPLNMYIYLYLFFMFFCYLWYGFVAEQLGFQTLNLMVRGPSAWFLANSLRQATYTQEFSVHQAV